ncbi:MAG: hypothetical protein NT175_06390 [Bacteroidetes bacterium]|nr:hypothetical protein [Bacteroidota bacterium]
MKKLIITLLITVSVFSLVRAQAFQKGNFVANLGVGFGWYGYGYGVSSLPAFSLSGEYGFLDIENVGTISLGGIIGYKHASYDYSWVGYADKWVWNDIIVAARGAIHPLFIKNDKVDIYGGIALGVRLQTWKYSNNFTGTPEKFTDNHTDGLFAFYVGGRYFFTDNLAAFGELGYGLGYFTIGLSYKIK